MKKFIYLILVLTLLMSITTITFADQELTDTKTSDWFYPYIKTMTEKNIIKGYSDNTFKPQNTITYAEFIKMFVVAKTGQDVGNSSEGHWAKKYYDKGVEIGLFTKHDIPIDKLNSNIEREYMALIATNAVGGNEVADYNIIKRTISDLNEVSINDYYTVQAYGHGILTGYPDGTFKPKQTLTRAESAAVLMRYLDPSERKKPDIDKIKEQIKKEEERENYWKNDPDYDEVVKWIEDNTPTHYISGAEFKYNKIAWKSPEFRLEDGKFIVISQGGEIYRENRIQNNKNYPNIHKDLYMTFKELMKLCDKKDVYLTMSYNSATEGITMTIRETQLGDSYLFSFEFNEKPPTWNLRNGMHRVDFEVIPYVNFTQDGYIVAGKEFKTFDEALSKKMIGSEEYVNTVRNIFVNLYGEETGNKIMDYAMEKYQASYDYENKKFIILPYEKKIFDGINLSYDNGWVMGASFFIDKPKN